MKALYLTFFLLGTALLSYSQDKENAAFVENDDKTSVFTFNTKHPIPKRSALYSALVPGLGQIYNKQYWKLGVVVAGLGAAGYFLNFNNTEYQRFRNAYIARIDGDPNTVDEFDVSFGGYQAADLNTLQNQYRQYLEYTVVFTTVGYALNILDAYVGANLKSFDINDDISLQTKPTFENQQLGLALVFKIK